MNICEQQAKISLGKCAFFRGFSSLHCVRSLETIAGFSNLLVVCGSNDLDGEPSKSDSLLMHATGGLFNAP